MEEQPVEVASNGGSASRNRIASRQCPCHGSWHTIKPLVDQQTQCDGCCARYINPELLPRFRYVWTAAVIPSKRP